MSQAVNYINASPRENYPTKVVVRRLPPDLTPDAFWTRVSPLPKHNYLYFVGAENPKGFSRAYVNFERHEDATKFRKMFDGRTFLGPKGVEYTALVESAPFQNVPEITTAKNRDPKAGTIQSDDYYRKFLDAKRRKNVEIVQRPEFHFQPKSTADKEDYVTPLLKYISEKKRAQNFTKNRRYENCVVFVKSAAKKSHHVKTRRFV